MRIMRTITTGCSLALMLVSFAYGSDIYISQNTSGGNTGANCSNAHSASWFNSNATGGNTYHLCGTFTGSAGSTMLTAPASGSAGSPLIVQFETGALLTAPYWSETNGAISIANKSYVTIDGGSNGIIRATANGTNQSYKQGSTGIRIIGSSHIEVKNLTIRNMYQNAGSSSGATDTGGEGSWGIYIDGNNSYLDFHNNTISGNRGCIAYELGKSNSNINIYKNNLSDAAWHIKLGEGNGGSTSSNMNIYNNEITDWTNWQYPSETYHTDGIILYCNNNSTLPVSIYNNYIHGDLGDGSPTAFIFSTYGASSPGALATIFNNLLVSTGGVTIWLKNGRTGNVIYNNTIIGPSSSGGVGVMLENSSGINFRNNIIGNWQRAIGSYTSLTSQVAASNNNVVYNVSSSPFYYNDGSGYYTWAQWQALGFDASSSTANPSLDASYKLTSTGSSAYARGANFTSLGIAALNSDKSAVARPASGAWQAGAYQSEGGSDMLSAPQGLTIKGAQ
jgi:hypothetical protein